MRKWSAVLAASMMLTVSGCAGSPMGDALQVSTAPDTPAAPEAADTSQVPDKPSCNDLADEAVQLSKDQNKGTGNPLLIAIQRGKVTVDRFYDPPRRGGVLVCEGRGIWSSMGGSRVEYGYEAIGGDWFIFYRPA